MNELTLEEIKEKLKYYGEAKGEKE